VTCKLTAIHYPYAIDPAGGRLLQEADYEEYVKQLIYQVLLTSPGERVHRPDFGAGLRKMVFAPNSPSTASMTQTLVFQALDRWLGRLIRVDDLRAEAREERLEVTIVYTILAQGEQRFLNVEVAV
jgi:phage baseplate assembly protein W